MVVLFLRAIILYLLIFAVIRLTGKRQLSDLQPFDLIITLLIAELASEPAADINVPLLYGIVPIMALFLMQRLIAFLSLKSDSMRRLVCGRALILIEKGIVIEETLRSAHYTLDDLLEQLRGKDVYQIADVEYAILETNGDLSVMLKGHRQQPAFSDMGLAPPTAELPYLLIEDGKLHRDALKKSGHSEDWLAFQMKKMGYTHILLAVGAWKPGKLDIAGDVAGAIQWMKGVKAGNIGVAGNIAVIGGGNTAMDAARLAKRSGAKHVTLVYRRTRKYMPADEHELALALADGVEFAELAAPIKQADGVLQCEKMVLGEADASGRRSPVGSGAFFDIPCDLVISAVGEQVDDALMAANGIELDKKGRPAFQTNVEGVYAAGDAKRGPATVVEGIADAAAFAEAVIGKAHTYDIPEQAYVTKADAEAKKGILAMSGCICREGERCLQCATVCENCVDSCPNRANVTIRMADGSHQIVHVDKMCNECGNCTQFCPYASEPCHDKFTLFQTVEDMADSHNAGVLFLGGDKVRVRTFGEPKDYDLGGKNELPAELETLIVTIRDKYGYLYN